MKRTATLVLVLFAMLWQSLALAGPGSSVNLLADLQHAALHWQGEAHHHHGDSVHLDDSDESASHVALDQAGAAALHAIEPVTWARPGAAAPSAGPTRPSPNPILDGPLRPPRPAA